MEIEVKDLHKSFNDNHVLRGISFTVEEGVVTAIIGGSGSGKTVILKHLIGLLRPDKGAVYIDGQNINNMTESSLLPLRRRFGMIFQGSALFNSLSVGENVGLGLLEHRLATPDQVRRIVTEKLEILGLKGKENERPGNLSGGMKKRVAIARALTMDPEIILYDEPTTGLDPPMAEDIDDLIIHLNKEIGITSVVVTHDMVSVFKVAGRIHMLHEGKIIHTGTPKELEQSDNPFVKEFVKRR
ncbi:MAG: ABC transporter ATP-binding protein [bacterium]